MKQYISNQDSSILEAITDSISKIFTYVEPFLNADEFYENTQAFDAAIMNFIVIGEMVSKLSDSFKNKIDYIDWINIIGFRNILAHDYFGIDSDEVWQIIMDDLQILYNQILHIIN